MRWNFCARQCAVNSVGTAFFKPPTNSYKSVNKSAQIFYTFKYKPKNRKQNRKSSEFYNFAVRNVRTPQQENLFRNKVIDYE